MPQIELCLNQFLRPRQKLMSIPGNCVECQTDDDNKKCQGYVPITVFVLDEEESEE